MLLCYYYEISLIICSPFPFTAVATTIIVILLCSPFPLTAIATASPLRCHHCPPCAYSFPSVSYPWNASFFASRRGGLGAVVAHLTLAAVAKEVHETSFLLYRFPELLLCLLHDDEYTGCAPHRTCPSPCRRRGSPSPPRWVCQCTSI